jgi:predicted MPP superfamily phosphohydrolase
VLPQPPHSIPHVRLAYASDFHAGPTTDPDVIAQACKALRSTHPDAVLLGGDFINFSARDIDPILPALKQVAETAPTFAVLGNHDWIADPGKIRGALETAGVQVLINRNVRLPAPFDSVWICGLDDHWCGYPDAAKALSGAEGVRIVLMHAPSGLLDLGNEAFDLAFCGHTHGGQIALPGGYPLVLPKGRLSRVYPRGRYQLPAGRTLIVSVGVGCALLPIRINANPEVVVCTVSSSHAMEPSTNEG